MGVWTPNSRHVDSTREGMNPTLVAVNRPTSNVRYVNAPGVVPYTYHRRLAMILPPRILGYLHCGS